VNAKKLKNWAKAREIMEIPSCSEEVRGLLLRLQVETQQAAGEEKGK